MGKLFALICIITYIIFYARCSYIMVDKTGELVIPLLLSMVPIFNMAYVIWVQSPAIKRSLYKIFTKNV